MPNYNSVQLGGTRANARTFPTPGVGVGGRTSHWARGEYTLTGALVLTDTIQLFDLPRNSRVVSGFVKSDDLDTGGAGLRIDVGDAALTTRYLTGGAGTPGPVAGATPVVNPTGLDFNNTAKTRVFATVSAAPTTSATTGTLVVMLEYVVEEPK